MKFKRDELDPYLLQPLKAYTKWIAITFLIGAGISFLVNPTPLGRDDSERR